MNENLPEVGPRNEPGSYGAWIELLAGLHKDDKDAVVVISGRERSGKSTLAWTLASQVDPSFNAERMVFSGSDFMREATKLPRGRALVLDEAIQGGFSRDAMTDQNRSLAKFLVVAGERNLVSFVLFPNLRWLDPYISEHRARWWVLVERRGVALVHEMRRADYRGSKPSWKRLFRIRFNEVVGPEWEKYTGLKEKLVRNVANRADDRQYVPDEREVEDLAQKILILMDEEEKERL